MIFSLNSDIFGLMMSFLTTKEVKNLALRTSHSMSNFLRGVHFAMQISSKDSLEKSRDFYNATFDIDLIRTSEGHMICTKGRHMVIKCENEFVDVTKMIQTNRVRSIDASISKIKDLTLFNGVKKIMVRDCNELTKLSAVPDVEEIDLSYCMNLSCFSSLKNIHTVNLTLTNIKQSDLTALSKSRIHTLILRENDINDVSMFGNVHTLDVSHTHVSNVSALKNANTLYLEGTRVTDVSSLANVENLFLSGTDVSDVSALGKQKILDLSYTDVTDVSSLGNVRNLNLSFTNVSNVFALGKVHTLNLDNTPVIDVSPLTENNTLSLRYTPVKDVTSLANIPHLDLSHSCVTDMRALGRQKTLKISHTRITDVSSLKNVHTLDISHTKIHNIEQLANVKNLINNSPKPIKQPELSMNDWSCEYTTQDSQDYTDFYDYMSRQS